MASNYHGNCSNNNHAKRNHSSRTTCTSSSGRAYQEPFAMQNTTKEERPMSEFGTTPLKDEEGSSVRVVCMGSESSSGIRQKQSRIYAKERHHVSLATEIVDMDKDDDDDDDDDE